MWRGELGERKDAEGREPLLCVERQDGDGDVEYGKNTPPQKQLDRKWKIGNSHRIEKKREKGERKGFKFH